MKRMGKKWFAGVMVGGWLLAGASAEAAQLVKTDQTEINLRGRMQLFGVGQALTDDFRNDSRLYLFLRQARLGFSARWNRTASIWSSRSRGKKGW